jgi:mRNA-degrading endonuclease YafQ of YafQ-DinJ toxin-antitoxin module
MDVQINITKDFDKDLKKMSSSDNQSISVKINYLIDLLRADQKIGRQLYRLHKIPQVGDLDSSIYLYKINKTIRIVLTFEDDPLFDQKIITLLRAVHHDKLESTFKGLQEAIYQSYLNQRRKNG